MRLNMWIASLISSRKVFKNYLLSNLQYLIFKRLFPYVSISVKCIDGSIASLSVDEYYALLVGLRRGIIVNYSCSDNAVVLFNGLKISLSEFLELDPRALLLGWKYNGGFWELNGVKMKHLPPPVVEVFNYRMYDRLRYVKGSVVVDVGAGVGDSVIYFILRGAEKVIALEPNIKYCYEMLENFRLNNVEGSKVVVLSRSADSHTLSELVSEYSIDDGVLKMDCEGCEYEVLLNTPAEVLRHFREVLVEYHGSPKPLVKKLIEVGFKVSVEKPWAYIRTETRTPIPVGFIYAEV